MPELEKETKRNYQYQKMSMYLQITLIKQDEKYIQSRLFYCLVYWHLYSVVSYHFIKSLLVF